MIFIYLIPLIYSGFPYQNEGSTLLDALEYSCSWNDDQSNEDVYNVSFLHSELNDNKITDPDSLNSVAVMKIRAEVVYGQSASWAKVSMLTKTPDKIANSLPQEFPSTKAGQQRAVLILSLVDDTELVINVSHPKSHILKNHSNRIHSATRVSPTLKLRGEVHIALSWENGEIPEGTIAIEYL